MDELFSYAREVNKLELEQLEAVKYLLEASDDVAHATVSIGNCKATLPLTHADVIAMFIDFLDSAIDYYKSEV